MIPTKEGAAVVFRSLDPSKDFTTAPLTVVESDRCKVVKLGQLAGSRSGRRSMPDEILLNCLSGRFDVTVDHDTHSVKPGELVYIAPGHQHSWRCIEQGELVLTVIYSSDESRTPEIDRIDETLEETFPASDAPPWTP